MATMKSLEDVFINELQDLLHAEKQITKALPRMVKKAAHSELKDCLQQHLAETEGQIGRLEQCFELLGRRPRARKCTGMEGLIDEGKETLHEDAEPDVLDAHLICAAQKVEHYEIAGYGTVCTWAETLGHDEVARLLKQNLAEEKEADQKLTRIAEQVVNLEAVHA